MVAGDVGKYLFSRDHAAFARSGQTLADAADLPTAGSSSLDPGCPLLHHVLIDNPPGVHIGQRLQREP